MIAALSALAALVIAVGSVVGSVLTYRAVRRRDDSVARLDSGKLELDRRRATAELDEQHRRAEAEREQRMQARVDELVEQGFERLSTELDAERQLRQRLDLRVKQLELAMRDSGVPIPPEPPYPPPTPPAPTVAGGTS